MNISIEFNFLWDKAIQPAIELVFECISPEFKSYCSLQKKNFAEYKLKLYRLYKQKERWLGKMYLPHKNGTEVLDMHKRASLITGVMLLEKPFRFDINKAKRLISDKFNEEDTADKDNTEWFVHNIYANYTAAIIAGLGVVYIDTVYDFAYHTDLIENNDIQEEQTIQNAVKELTKLPAWYKALIGYPKRKRHEGFLNSCILNLAKNDYMNINFDYLAYAIIFFQLQEMNLNYLNDNPQDSLKDRLLTIQPQSE